MASQFSAQFILDIPGFQCGHHLLLFPKLLRLAFKRNSRVTTHTAAHLTGGHLASSPGQCFMMQIFSKPRSFATDCRLVKRFSPITYRSFKVEVPPGWSVSFLGMQASKENWYEKSPTRGELMEITRWLVFHNKYLEIEGGCHGENQPGKPPARPW